MSIMKKLPDAEFEIMSVVWKFSSPVTIGMLTEVLNEESGKVWKPQTVHTLLGRLEGRGFLKTEKEGKERYYEPLIKQDDYLRFETRNFVEKYCRGSRLALINTMYQDEKMSDDDMAQLLEWIEKMRKDR